jgi:hypothetical protein
MDTELRPGADSIVKRIAELSRAKREVVDRLLRERKIADLHRSGIPRRPASNTAPLSFAQQRLWFLDQLTRGHPYYNESNTLRLSFPLNVAAMERSVNEVVRRHEALRTTFIVVDGQPVQVIAPTLTLPVPVVDLRALPELRRQTEAQRLATEEAQQPFDLAQGPLMRTTLLCLCEEDYVAILTMHHIICDNWSMGVLVGELISLYRAYSERQPSPLPELPIQYADFAVWQRKWLQGEVLESQLAYWKRQLADLPVLQLPTDHPRPAVQSFRGARQAMAISEPVYAALKALSQQEEVTLFMVLLAAFQTLLHCYTGQDDIVVGAPTANRNRAEIEGLIGFFVNTLVMRSNLSGNPSFREVLRRVREVALGAYAHQDLPFERLVEALQPERDASRNPLFQVTFQLFSWPRWPGVSPEQMLDLRSVEIGTAKFDLRFDLMVTPEGLRGFLEYNTALFDAATITRMIGRLQTLLEGIVVNPAQRLSEFPPFAEAKQERRPKDMVPLASVPLASPLLTPNVKVDRQALAAPDHRGAERGISFVAPTTEVERTIATAWQGVLGLAQVGVGDNFFDLGGHSLLLVQLQSKLREVLGREVAILDLLRYPTVSALAKALRPETGEALVFEVMQNRAEKQRAAMSRRKPSNLGRTASDAVP